MGCGWYRDHYYPASAEIDRRSVDSLADELVAEIEQGADGTGVRPGLIGEIGTEKFWMSPTEERVHRAAARAAARTGLPITTHSFASDVGLWQLQVLTRGRRRPVTGDHRACRLLPDPLIPRDPSRGRSHDRVRHADVVSPNALRRCARSGVQVTRGPASATSCCCRWRPAGTRTPLEVRWPWPDRDSRQSPTGSARPGDERERHRRDIRWTILGGY